MYKYFARYRFFRIFGETTCWIIEEFQVLMVISFSCILCYVAIVFYYCNGF